MATITSANSIFTLAIIGLFDSPQRLQGFAADDICDTESVESAETVMGVDGILVAGVVYAPIKQTVMLQADSESTLLFDEWRRVEQSERVKYYATGVITFPSLNAVYTCTRGVLTHYSPISDAKKVLQPRKFGITWQSIHGMPA